MLGHCDRGESYRIIHLLNYQKYICVQMVQYVLCRRIHESGGRKNERQKQRKESQSL